MTTRNSTIDVAKGLGILLVVLGHNWLVLHERGELFRVVFSFHVPLFFFLAGVFLQERAPLGALVSRRFDALIKPYLVVLLVLGIFRIAAQPSTALHYFEGLAYATGGTIAWEHLWFLPSLFLSLVLAALLLELTARLPRARLWRLALALAMLVGGALLLRHLDDPAWAERCCASMPADPERSLGLPLSTDLLLVTCAFTLLGFVARERALALRFQPLGFAVALAAFIALHVGFDEAIDLNRRYYGNVWIASAQALLGIYLIGALAAVLRAGRVRDLLVRAGEGSLFILIFHVLVQAKAFNAFHKLGLPLPAAALAALPVAVVVPLLLLEIAKRVRPLGALLLPRPARAA